MQPAQLWTKIWSAGMVQETLARRAGITLQNLQGLFLSRTTGAQTPSSACPEQSRCEALGAEQTQEQLVPKYHRVLHTKAAHSWLWFLKVCGEVPHFSLAPAGRQPLAPSVGEQLKVCMPSRAQLPAGFISKPSGRHKPPFAGQNISSALAHPVLQGSF